MIDTGVVPAVAASGADLARSAQRARTAATIDVRLAAVLHAIATARRHAGDIADLRNTVGGHLTRGAVGARRASTAAIDRGFVAILQLIGAAWFLAQTIDTIR